MESKTESKTESKKDADNGKKLTQNRKRWLLIALAVFLFLGFIFALYWVFVGRFYETTDDAYVSGNIIQVMPQITGHVTEILADETNFVAKNQPIILLDKADATIALESAESQLALTTRQVNQLYQNVDQLQASVKEAEDNLEKTKEDYERRHGLVVNQTITVEDLRHAKLAYDSAAQALYLARHQLTAAIDIIGTTDLYHHPRVQQAIVNLRNAYLTWGRTTIRAPENGYVAKRPVQIGQQVTPDTVLMVITPLNQIWVNANFKESQLRNIRIGQPVKLVSDIYGGDVTYDGIVMGINGGAGDVFDLLPPQNATGNWIKVVQRLPVRIIIKSDELIKHPLRLGLSMTVTVNTHDRKGTVLSKLPTDQILYKGRDDVEDLKNADQIINKILQENAKDITYHPPQQTPQQAPQQSIQKLQQQSQQPSPQPASN